MLIQASTIPYKNDIFMYQKSSLQDNNKQHSNELTQDFTQKKVCLKPAKSIMWLEANPVLGWGWSKTKQKSCAAVLSAAKAQKHNIKTLLEVCLQSLHN